MQNHYHDGIIIIIKHNKYTLLCPQILSEIEQKNKILFKNYHYPSPGKKIAVKTVLPLASIF